MTDEHDGHTELRAPTLIIGLVVTIALTMFGAGAAWYSFARTLNIEQPLVITACTLESYTTPAAGQRGPKQADCDAPYNGPDDTHPASEPIAVAGQVCNDGDRPVSYEVVVGWQSVDVAGFRVNQINVPITYEPGCNPPYRFEFVFPVELIGDDVEPGGSLGRWRIVGLATPTDPAMFARYQWDVVKTVEIVND